MDFISAPLTSKRTTTSYAQLSVRGSPTVFTFNIGFEPILLCEDTWMTHPLKGACPPIPVPLIKRIDVAFDTTTVHRTFAKDADYQAAVAELIRP